MKKTMWAVMLCGAVLLAVIPVVRAQVDEITTVEAQLINGLDGSLVKAGGPWTWGPDAQGSIQDIPPNTGLTLQVQCINAAGDMVYTGKVNDITILPVNPFTNLGFLFLFATPDGITVDNGLSGPRFVELVPLESQTLTLTLDIKPGSDKNPVNAKSKGVLPFVILGTADMDVELIDVNSLLLAGVSPIGYSIGDMESVDDQTLTPDGYKDLLLKFRTADVVKTLGEVTDGQVIELELTGSLSDGTVMTGTDQIEVQGKGKKNGAKK
jgi:hypothetical protein